MSNSKRIIKPFVLTHDPLVQKLIERFANRSESGIKRFRRTMLEAVKPIEKWIEDAQEESWDNIVYLEKIKIERGKRWEKRKRKRRRRKKIRRRKDNSCKFLK